MEKESQKHRKTCIERHTYTYIQRHVELALHVEVSSGSASGTTADVVSTFGAVAASRFVRTTIAWTAIPRTAVASSVSRRVCVHGRTAVLPAAAFHDSRRAIAVSAFHFVGAATSVGRNGRRWRWRVIVTRWRRSRAMVFVGGWRRALATAAGWCMRRASRRRISVAAAGTAVWRTTAVGRSTAARRNSDKQ